jgi:alpha-N-acetylglucosamine transferase
MASLETGWDRQAAPQEHHHRDAYAAFLTASTFGAKDNNYYEDVRLLLFALKHDPETRDDRGRDLLVLTTDLVAPEHEKQLEHEGAISRHVEFLDWAFEGSDSPFIPTYKHQETKLRIFEQDDYDTLMYIDADHLVLKPWTELWEEYYSMPMASVTAQEDTVWENGRGIDRTDGPVLFNAGFMIVRPDRNIFRSLLTVTDYYPGFQDQVRLHMSSS